MVLFALLIVAADPVAGTWAGTSLCRLRPSACNDERVVYHVTPLGSAKYRFVMNKIVNGAEAEMGQLEDARYDATHHQLIGTTTDRTGAVHKWLFHVGAKHMSGRLVTPDGRLSRAIEVDRR